MKYSAGRDQGVKAVERAFQLANSGRYASISAIKKRLSAEGYPIDQIFGRSLLKQLNALIQAARG